MKKNNRYWENLVSDLYHQDEDNSKQFSHNSLDSEFDYHWARSLKNQLGKVFVWDLFDKNEAKTKLDYRTKNTYRPIIQLSRRMWFRAAVILIAVISGASLHALFQGMGKEIHYSEIIVPPGQMTQIKLSDGSKIWLNSGSVFKYPTEFDKSTREVFIDGEAFMEVAKNPHKPFVVNTHKFSVEVLGTSFNIDAYSDDNKADVTLVEGSVLLSSKEKNWKKKMVPGQIASIKNGELPLVSEVNTEFYVSWTEGKIVFRKESLETIAKKLERWYNVEIKFKSDELKKLEFSGTFLMYKPVEQVFRSLSIMDGHIDFVSENRTDEKNIIYISKKK